MLRPEQMDEPSRESHKGSIDELYRLEEIYAADVNASGVDERKLMRKVDLRLIPWLSLLYLLSFLDRTNIGNAKLCGLEEDLKITDRQYLLTLTIFFFPYAFFEVPSNVFLKRLRPSIWLSLLMLLWGIMMTVQGLVHNYGGLLGMRWMLGMMEAGLFPGVNYYLSCWYKRSEFGIRAAIFFSAASASGAFGGLFAAAISNMDGIGGKRGWQWIFIIEGLMTVIAGALSYWIIQDFPDSAKFLSAAERAVIVRRLQSDDQYSAAGERLELRNLWRSIVDLKTWLGMMVSVGSIMPVYAFSLFLPSIISQLGYKSTAANLLTVPVYAFACIVTCIVGLLADRYGNRGLFNIGFLCIGAAGYIILIASESAVLSYVGVYLATCGIYPLIPNATVWVSNNVEGSYKRSVTIAMVLGFGNINGAVSSNVYRAQDQPWYRFGHGIVLLYIGIGIIFSVVNYAYLRRENATRDRGERDEVIDSEPEYTAGINVPREKEGAEAREARALENGRFATIADAKREKGDAWSGYRYML
ncbi:MFS general substrate transporter [Peniophora sp. CONT]|nr:MFS general substrate transporter [Peniophora sp. CONT]